MHSPHDALMDGGAFSLVSAVLLAIPVALLGLYLSALAAGRGRRRWSPWRTVSFISGCAMVITALVPPLAPLAHHDLRVHMVQHLLLGMLGPVGLVLGAPITLALRTVPAQIARRLMGFLRSRPLHTLTHPVTALILNIGGMAVLYTTPIYAAMADSPALHLVVHVHFLAAGCLFSWAIVGIGPGPARKPPSYRLAVLFFAISIHAALSKAMYAYGWPHGTMHPLSEIEQAAQIMYYGGDFSEALLAVALFACWSATSSSAGAHERPQPGA